MNSTFTPINHSFLIGMDFGRWKIKVAAMMKDGITIKKDSFLSLVSDYVPQQLGDKTGFTSGDSLVEYRGKKYFVGGIANNAGNATRTLKQESKAGDDMLVMALTSLYRLGVEGDIKIVICTPIDSFRNDEGDLKSLLIGQHFLGVDGIEKRFNIMDVKVTAEAVASSYSISEDNFLGYLSYFLNVGSYKSNFAAFDADGNFIDRRSGSMKEIGWNRYKAGSKEQKVDSLVPSAVSDLTAKDWDKEYIDPETGDPLKAIVFLSGGATSELIQPMEKQLRNKIPHLARVVAMKDPLFADADGCLQIAYNQWGNE